MSTPKIPTDDSYQKAIAQGERIQSRVKTAPRLGRLKDKVCIITGAGSLKGIGRTSAFLFAHEGARHLYLLDFAGENLPELKQTIETTYPDVKATVVQADATDEEAIKGLCNRALEEEGRLDVFFANAGTAALAPLPKLTPEHFMRTMRINTLSVFLALKHASVAMSKPDASHGKSESGGSIILTASIAGLKSGAGPFDYSASKAAVNNMAQTAAYQFAGQNIRVNSICPGFIKTEMTGLLFEPGGVAAEIGRLCPLDRHGVPEEIAQAALYLASDESSYVNAQNLAVDGGATGSLPAVRGLFN